LELSKLSGGAAVMFVKKVQLTLPSQAPIQKYGSSAPNPAKKTFVKVFLELSKLSGGAAVMFVKKVQLTLPSQAPTALASSEIAVRYSFKQA
jgi:hypothetical protein